VQYKFTAEELEDTGTTTDDDDDDDTE